MSPSDLLRLLARRWAFVAPMTVLAVIAVVSVGRAMASSHEATAIAVLLPGAADVTADALERDDATEGEEDDALRSPYLRVSETEQRAADALVRGLKDRKLPGDIEVTIEEDQPILRVSARGASAAQAETDALAAVDVIRDHIETRQRALGVPEVLFLRLDMVAEPAAERINEDRIRAMSAVGALGLALVVGTALVIERLTLVPWRVRAKGARDRGPVTVLTVFALALVLVPQIHSIGPFAVTGPMLVGTMAGALWGAGRFLRTGRAPPMPRVAVALIAFIAASLASYALAQLRALEVVEARGADRQIAFLVMFGGITLLAAEGLRTAGHLRRLLVVFVVIGAVHALVGVLQAVGGLDVPGLTRVNSPRGGFPRVAGTARHPIDFGVFCATVLPLALHFASFAMVRRARLAAAAGAGLLVTGAGLSVTRSALLGVAVGSVVLLAGREGPRRWVLLGTGVVVLALTPLVVPNFAQSVVEMVGGTSESPSIQSRLADYEPVLDHVLRQPVLGRGAGTFEPSIHFVLDNNYLSLLVEVGLVGLVAFLAIVATAVMASRSVRRQSADPATRDLAQAMVAAIAVLAVTMGTYDLLAFQLGGGSLFLLLGCIAALERHVAPALPLVTAGVRPVLTEART